jgi:hypothetical protein
MFRYSNRQRGAALIALLAIILLAASWMLVSKLNATSSDIAAARRERNAVVLNQAKQALIGYVAAQAAKMGEPRPGALPCPEAAGFFDDPTQDGQAAGSCALPKVGRFPWRTIGTDKLVDAYGEPLWYVVSPGWAYTSSPAPVINSNTPGQLTLDGVANSAVALLIAPGAAITVAGAPGCAARSQVRPTAGNPDWRNYLECENATSPADATFVTSGPSASFNDQVLRITTADLLPGIEAAVANRIERDIVPLLKSVYAPPDWGIAGADPVYPFAAPFANPGPGAGTSSFQGAAGSFQGLLPFNFSEGCNPLTDPRCTTSFVSWDQAVSPNVQKTGGSADLGNENCSFPSATTVQCAGRYDSAGTLQVNVTARARNVAMALRQLDSTQAITEIWNPAASTWDAVATANSASGVLRTNGSSTIGLNVPIPSSRSSGTNFRITVNIAILRDHPLLDPTDSTTGWFVRNEWYRLAYYAVAQGHTAAALPSAPACTTGGAGAAGCLSVANVTPAGAQRAILVLAGRSINGSVRPSSTLGDYLEFGNATAAYERQPVSTAIDATLKKPFNDRVVVLGTN